MDEIGDLALIVHSSDSYLPVQDQIPSVIVQWPTYERGRKEIAVAVKGKRNNANVLQG